MKNSLLFYLSLGMICIPSTGFSQAALPTGLVFYTSTDNCPTGSSPNVDAQGRLIFVTSVAEDIGKTQGTPMADKTDHTHTHVGTMSVLLKSKSISGASSCCNGQATSKGTHTSDDTTTGAQTTGLPFIQLMVCTAD